MDFKRIICLGAMLTALAVTGCGEARTVESKQVRTKVEESVSGQEIEEYQPSEGETIEEVSDDVNSDAEAAQTVTEDGQEEIAVNRAPVHGIYLSAYVAGSPDLMEDYLAHMDESAINAVVIDIKNDEGRVTWETGTAMVEELGSTQRLIRDLPGLLETLHEHDVYVIGRFVTFREMYLKDIKPEWMVKNTDGSVYQDKKGFCWIDPTNEQAWEYIEEIVKACTEAGFDEIQFDYVRYGTGITEEMIGLDGAGRQQAVTAFAAHMQEVFEELGVPYSLDVFGTIINSEVDRKIVGQDYAALSGHTDYLSPMVYPSHYYDGSFGIAYPDEKPYETVKNAMLESNRVLAEGTWDGVGRNGADDGAFSEDIAEKPETNPEGTADSAGVRPWIQGFTASYLSHYIKYGGEQIREQILAVYEAGHEEWLIWNPSCKYPWEELTEEKLPQFEEVQERVRQEREAQEAREAAEQEAQEAPEKKMQE